MNAARRQICADLRLNGFTGKQAYEFTKADPTKWQHAQRYKGALIIPGRPNHRAEKPADAGLTWIARHAARKMKEATEKKVRDLQEAQANYLKRRQIAREMAEAKK